MSTPLTWNTKPQLGDWFFTTTGAGAPRAQHLGNSREFPEIITSTGAKFWLRFCLSVLVLVISCNTKPQLLLTTTAPGGHRTPTRNVAAELWTWIVTARVGGERSENRLRAPLFYLVAQTLHQGCRATAVALHLCSIFGLMFSQCRTTVALHPWKGLKKGTVAAASVLLAGV